MHVFDVNRKRRIPDVIENFSSTKTIGINAIVSDGDFSRTISTSIPKISFPETEKEECEKLKSKLEKQPMTVENIEKAKFKIKPKKFMSQTDFRCEMNKIYGYSIDESTVVAQTLYEAGFITFPKTDTQYLSTKERNGFITFASKKKDKNGKWRPCRIKISVTYPEDSQFPKYTVEKISEVQSRTQKSEETK